MIWVFQVGGCYWVLFQYFSLVKKVQINTVKFHPNHFLKQSLIFLNFIIAVVIVVSFFLKKMYEC